MYKLQPGNYIPSFVASVCLVKKLLVLLQLIEQAEVRTAKQTHQATTDNKHSRFTQVLSCLVRTLLDVYMAEKLDNVLIHLVLIK